MGDAASQAVAIARGMLGLINTKVLLGQFSDVDDEIASLLELSPRARAAVTGWAMGATGQALWLIGGRKFKVQSIRTQLEENLTYTKQAYGSSEASAAQTFTIEA